MGLLKKEHAPVLNNVIVYLAMPSLIFRAVVTAELSLSLLVVPALAVGIVLLCMAAAYAVGRLGKLKGETLGALILVSAIGNTGFLGYPLALQLFGIDNLVRAVFYDMFGTVIIMFTIGLLVAQRFGSGEYKVNVLREVATFPPLLGMVAALVLIDVELPRFLTDAIGFLAGAAIPLIMFTIGLALEFKGVGKYRGPIAAAGLIKLAVSPLIALLAASAAGLEPVDFGTLVLEASMPTFLFSLILGLRYGLDTEFIPAAIVTTTMLSMITIPLWQYIAQVTM